MHIVALPTLLCANGISHNVCIPTLKRSLGRQAAFAKWTTPRYTRIARRSISEGDGSHTADSHEDEGPVFAPLDQDDVGGLGGTSEDLFGPLVRLWFVGACKTADVLQIRLVIKKIGSRRFAGCAASWVLAL